MTTATRPLTIALVAGEASGDQLGGKLISALRQRYPHARFCGIGGDHMRAAGFESWWDRKELSVMGLVEVLRHLPRLLRLRRALFKRLLDERPDLLIGIDAPDFNLGLERRARNAGITTVHYVSPTVWAWRQGRAAKIGRSADLVLCLFPFEPDFYADQGVRAEYTGHPMADVIDADPPADHARQALALNPQQRTVALLPGSRQGEVSRLAEPLIAAALQLQKTHPDLQFVAALADTQTGDLLRQALAAAPALKCTVVTGRALEVMAASDLCLVASGTATLECLLVNRPMVVVYRLAESTHWLASRLQLVKSPFIALPNILAGESLAPELIQDQANGPEIAAAAAKLLDDPQGRAYIQQRFAALHQSLRCDAAAQAAAAIGRLLAERGRDR